jgi:hypothetical protein
MAGAAGLSGSMSSRAVIWAAWALSSFLIRVRSAAA